MVETLIVSKDITVNYAKKYNKHEPRNFIFTPSPLLLYSMKFH